jgi:hypothetical protein
MVRVRGVGADIAGGLFFLLRRHFFSYARNPAPDDDDDKSSLFSYASLAYDETPIIKLPILPFCGLQTAPFLQNLQIPAEVFATD